MYYRLAQKHLVVTVLEFYMFVFLSENALCTWKAKSWYFCFSLGPRAYHHSPRILLTVLLSWFGCRWCTNARWRLLKIINAFIGRRMWSFSLWKSDQERQRHITLHILVKVTLTFLMFWWEEWKDYLSRAVLISIFGQRTEGLSAPLYWGCRDGLLRYNSWEEAAMRQQTGLCF